MAKCSNRSNSNNLKSSSNHRFNSNGRSNNKLRHKFKHRHNCRSNNNSAGTLAPMIDCRFTNAGKLVEETRVLVPGVGPGVRGGLTIYGPRTDLFVDRADCRIVSP